jgi:hypothetical protein
VTGDGVARLREKQPVHYIAMAPFSLMEDAAASSAPPPALPPVVAPATAPTLAGEVPVFQVAPIGSPPPPTIDGRGDEEIWKGAPQVRFDTDYAGRSTGVFTTARFLYSPTALYALFELESADLNVNPAFPVDKERKDLYEEDCVELMLVPSAAEPFRFFEIELGPLGHFYDLELNRKTKPAERPAWSSALRVATTREIATRRVTIEAAFLAPEIAAMLKPGARLPAGIFRMDGKKPRRYLSWRPARTPSPNFHVPEAFGYMQLLPVR